MTTGEAAGVAAAMCAAQSVPTHELAIGTLQGALRDAKVFLGEELAGAA